MLGVFLDRGTLAPADLELGALEDSLPEWRTYDATAPEEVAERVADASVVVLNKVRLGAPHMERARDLRLVCIAATGTDNVDLEAARARGITVCNVAGYGTAAVSQHTLALMLALATRLVDYHCAVQAGRWTRSTHFCFLDYPIAELAGRTLGIVGHGAIGRAVARGAEALGMRVRVAARPGGAAGPDRVPFEDLVAQADVLSLHCPLTPETRGLVGGEALARMKCEAMLVNTARGGIVDEAALADALRRGDIAGAGVDVLSVEPPREDSPLLAGDIPNLVVTPHVAWGTREARQRVVDELVGLVRAYLEGRPYNVVT